MSRKPKTVNPDEIDPSVYYYDEVYDDMKKEEASEKEATETKSHKTKRESKYIQGLIETANQRKSDNEIRKFKRYAREREDAEEQGQLDGVEVIVTSAYRRKLDEIDKLNAEKKQRLDKEKSRELNFTSSKRESKSKEERSGKDDIKINHSSSSRAETESETQPLARVSLDFPGRSARHKTMDERRQLLRTILTKRTIGAVFDAAVARYKERKDGSQKPL